MRQVNGNNLRKVRTGRGLTLRQLEEASGITQSTIHQIEKGKRLRPHLSTVKKLADTLGVEPDKLMGEDIEEDKPSSDFFSRRSSYRMKMADDARNALRIVADRYDCEPEHIVDLAPFLFHWAAEASLRERQSRLDAINAKLSELEGVEAPEHLADYYLEGWRGDESLAAEQQSIDKRDLFGLLASSDAQPENYEPSEQNPWVQFLKSLANQSGQTTEFDYWTPRWNHFAYRVATEDVLDLVGGDQAAAEHILSGRARLHELPQRIREAEGEAIAKWAVEAGEQAIAEFEESDLLGLGG